MNKMKTKTRQNEPESRRPIHSARVPGSRVTGLPGRIILIINTLEIIVSKQQNLNWIQMSNNYLFI